ncbi:hypothetical protein L2E82_22134 [Cichorium intybus]|uniref:Uncharacterized protein n=1 Tax=Cichorium intybus TaxID=13427 RepID=A0ACB9DWI6_CICIN|nr:hypothetical protein L2E82_22134 [Cichorium intybus]
MTVVGEFSSPLNSGGFVKIFYRKLLLIKENLQFKPQNHPSISLDRYTCFSFHYFVLLRISFVLVDILKTLGFQAVFSPSTPKSVFADCRKSNRLQKMAMNVIQDQNFSVKTNGSTVQKNRGGLGGRKALNDISNSGKPPALNTSRKQNPKNVIPIGEDLGVPKKAHVSGRKALVDLTNSVKPFTQQQSLKKKNQGKKPIAIAEECFLHNHDECIKSQKKSLDLDLDQFLKTIGLHEDVCCESVTRTSRDENVSMFVEMDDILEPIIEDEVGKSPICGSPNSPERVSYMKDYDEFPSFILTETPRRSK